MISFLFWNLNNKELQESIARLAYNWRIDILIFAELSLDANELSAYLNGRNGLNFDYAPGLCERIKIFSRFSPGSLKPIFESNTLTIRHVQLPAKEDFLLAAVHFPSKIYWSDDSQALECAELGQRIAETERRLGHSRTILVGDLNMNPFEGGVVGANALHAVMSRSIAGKRTRIVQNKKYTFFYNPMWSLFGDASPGPPGTYYFSRAEHKTFFWNMFDQVLIRPDLLASFSNENLMVLDSDGKRSLLTSDGVPDRKHASDHLPIYFMLKL